MSVCVIVRLQFAFLDPHINLQWLTPNLLSNILQFVRLSRLIAVCISGLILVFMVETACLSLSFMVKITLLHSPVNYQNTISAKIKSARIPQWQIACWQLQVKNLSGPCNSLTLRHIMFYRISWLFSILSNNYWTESSFLFDLFPNARWTCWHMCGPFVLKQLMQSCASVRPCLFPKNSRYYRQTDLR